MNSYKIISCNFTACLLEEGAEDTRLCLEDLQRFFYKTRVFAGTPIQLMPKGEFSFNITPEFECISSSSEVNVLAELNFSISFKSVSAGVHCCFEFGVDFPGNKINLHNLFVSEGLRGRGVMKNTLLNVFKGLVTFFSEIGNFDVGSDQIIHVATFKFLFPDDDLEGLDRNAEGRLSRPINAEEELATLISKHQDRQMDEAVLCRRSSMLGNEPKRVKGSIG